MTSPLLEAKKLPPYRAFLKIVILSFIFLQIVTLAGALVRVSGAGMGCPDWPFCFGLLIPPVSVDQLPANYETIFSVDGRPAIFNPVHTWIEFVNRLAGVLAGLSLLVQTFWSLRYRKTQRNFFTLSLVALVLTMAEGVLGAKVVSTYLKPVIVTLHYGLAVVILSIQLRLWFLLVQARQPRGAFVPLTSPIWERFAWWILLGMTLLQAFVGTRLREEWDAMVWGHELDFDHIWYQVTGSTIDLHRLWAYALGVLTMVMAGRFWRGLKTSPTSTDEVTRFKLVPITLVFGVILQIILGFAITSFNQEWGKPLHLMVANLMILMNLLVLWRFSSPRTPVLSPEV